MQRFCTSTLAMATATALLLSACAQDASSPVATDGIAAEQSGAPAAIPEAPRRIRAAIEARSEQWRQAFDARDAAAAAALYMQDAVLTPSIPPSVLADIPIPGFTGEGILGRPAIEVFVSDFDFPILVSKDDVTTTEVLLVGPAAAERGTWSATHDEGEGPVAVEGFYLRVWQRDGGEWRIARETFN